MLTKLLLFLLYFIPQADARKPLDAPDVASNVTAGRVSDPGQYGFISDRMSTLSSVFESILAIERELLWNPVVPSRMSRGFFLFKLFSNLLKVMPFKEFVEQVRNGVTTRASCLTCNILANVFTSNVFSTDIIAFATRAVCVVFRLQTPRVCYGMINSMRNVLDFVRLNSKLAPSDMCGVFLGSRCSTKMSENLNWTINIPEKLVADERKTSLRTASENSQPEQSFQVVQLTDIHFDPYFSPGTRTDCGEPVCCRAVNGPARTLQAMAGIWGDYTDCDTPYFTIDNALRRVAAEHPNAKYWLLTGDLPPHDVWDYNRNETLAHIHFMTWLVRQHSKNVQVYPVIGNHEGVPINSFAPPEVRDNQSSSWLYEYAADEWKIWLPEDALETLRVSGNYMVEVKPGFRILSLNSNYCARLNPWTLYNSVDPGNQLQWLANELFTAEKEGDKVHIIGHVPPDHRECTEAWLYNYIRIVQRFQETILAQFYGHTHRDEFRVVYSLDDPQKPISYQFISPSITSYSQTNPAYRVYTVDGHKFVSDYETYYFNLTESNTQSHQLPNWVLEYKAAETYSMARVTGESMNRILIQLETEEQAFADYYRRYYVRSEAEVAKSWDISRKQMILKDHRVNNPLYTSPNTIIPTR